MSSYLQGLTDYLHSKELLNELLNDELKYTLVEYDGFHPCPGIGEPDDDQG